MKELSKIEVSVNAKTFQPQQNAEAVAIVRLIGEMEDNLKYQLSREHLIILSCLLSCRR